MCFVGMVYCKKVRGFYGEYKTVKILCQATCKEALQLLVQLKGM